MDDDERRLWYMCDVGDYAVQLGIFYLRLEGIVEETGERLARSVENIDEEFARFDVRYGAIDLALLDDRFPVDTIREVKQELQKFRRHWGSLKEALRFPERDADNLAVLVRSSLASIDLMRKLGRDFAKSKGYDQYRNSEPQSRW